MFQVKDYLVHSDPPLEDDPARRVQHKTCDQTEDQVAIIRLFIMDVAGVCRQQMLERAEDLLNQVPPRPDPQYARGRELGRQAEQGEALLTGLISQDERDCTIRATRRAEPSIAAAWGVKALTPRPRVAVDEVAPVDLPSIGSLQGVSRFAWDKQGTLQGGADVTHPFGVAPPTSGHNPGGGQGEAASCQGRQALIEHALGPHELSATARPRPLGVGTTHGKVHGDYERAMATDDQPKHAINATDDAMVWATVPVAHQLQGLPILAKHRVVHNPRPLPATAGRLTHRRAMTPQDTEDIVAKPAQSFEPGALGQGAQDA
jgi:hypothetical protein